MCQHYELTKDGRKQYCGRFTSDIAWDSNPPMYCDRHQPFRYEYVPGSFRENFDVPVTNESRFMVSIRKVPNI